MPHNTKAILVDVNGRPIPQYFNPITDQYEPLYGVAGAARSVLYGPDGQPISASNRLPVDVGGAVDISDRADRQLGQVTLSGRTVTTVTPLPRAVRGSGQYGGSVSRPSGAVGCIAYLNIYGVTGTFAAGEGVDGRLFVRSSGIAVGVWGITTTKTTEAGRSHILVCYPGARREDGVSGGSHRDLRVLGMPATASMLVIINITGTFSGGEGIDCEMVLEWLF